MTDTNAKTNHEKVQDLVLELEKTYAPKSACRIFEDALNKACNAYDKGSGAEALYGLVLKELEATMKRKGVKRKKTMR